MALKKKNLAGKIADTVGLLMFVSGLGILFVGEHTDYFKWVADENGGMYFLRRYLDYPFYDMLFALVPQKRDYLYQILTAVLIHGVISVFYGFIGFMLGRFFSRR